MCNGSSNQPEAFSVAIQSNESHLLRLERNPETTFNVLWNPFVHDTYIYTCIYLYLFINLSTYIYLFIYLFNCYAGNVKSKHYHL